MVVLLGIDLDKATHTAAGVVQSGRRSGSAWWRPPMVVIDSCWGGH
jgi:hypothetical protein